VIPAVLYRIAFGDTELLRAVSAPRAGPFLLLGQKKWAKEKAARSHRPLPPLLAGIGARLTRRALYNTPRARSKVSQILRFRLRCSAAATGD